MKRLLDRIILDGELRKDTAATERLLDRTIWKDIYMEGYTVG
jgi:hypothetical protein